MGRWSTTIQSAVNHSGHGATIDIKPGKYVEGVIVKGQNHDGLSIVGTGKKPAAVLLEGKNAHGPGAPPRTVSRATASTISGWRT